MEAGKERRGVGRDGIYRNIDCEWKNVVSCDVAMGMRCETDFAKRDGRS